jgi:hypothetical protein
MSRAADFSNTDDDNGVFPRYEFIGIPYNGWGCESPFVTDVLDIDILLVVSYDEKLGVTDFFSMNVLIF